MVGREALLVGSIPLDTAEEVFRTFGGSLGPSLTTMPDGEVGPRKHWISKVHYQVLAGHPELEIVRRPQPENGVERLNPRNAADSWQFKVKDGSSIVSGAQYTPVSPKSFWRAGIGGASRPLPEREQERPRLSATRFRRPRAKWR